VSDTEGIPGDGHNLRIAFFSDSLPERNGTGAYYHDLIAHLGDRVAAAEIFQPLPKRRFNLVTLPLPGDRTQELAIPDPVRLRRAIDQLQPHIVVSVTPGPFGLLGRRLARRHGCGFLTAYHTDFAALADLYWGPVKRRLGVRALDTANRWLCRSSTSVLVNNSELVGRVRALGAPAVSVMGTPIEQAFLATPPPPAPSRPDPVVFAGRLAAEKNIDSILATARQLPGRRFIIAGDGPQRERVEAAASELDNIDYRGWLSRQALCAVLDEAGVVILPSYFETFGSIALEAMARQRPVLITANAGIHDWPQVADKLCVLRLDDETLAEALERLAATPPSEWSARGESSREGALQLHDATLNQWVEVLAAHARQEAQCGP
jgi:glycosyltransferase involved in cell wall biosynthesis